MPIGRASILTPTPIIGLVGQDRSVLALTLLLTRVLAVVDPDCYSDILVEGIRSVFLVQHVLDLVLKAVVEQLYKTLVVDFRPKYVLSEDRSVGRRRLTLP